MKPTNKLEIRNKNDNDFVVQVSTLTIGEEMTTIKGKTIEIGRNDLTLSTNTIQAGTTLLRQIEDVSGNPTITDVLRVSTSAGFRVTDDKVVNIMKGW